jgi:predicted Zn-dependent peptidase
MIDIRIRVGSSQETPEQNGIAHFIEHMIFKGSAARESGAVDAEMERLGGEISARTTRDATHYATLVPSGKWQEALALLAEALQSPAFREADMRAEAKVVQAEMAVARTDPEKLGFSRMAALIYDTTDASHLPLMGTEENVARFTPAALRTFHKTWYRPQNITVTLVGKVSLEEARRFVAFLFRPDAANAVAVKPITSVYAPLSRIVRSTPVPEQEQRGRELVTVLVAFRAPSVYSDEMLPIFDTLMPALASGSHGRFVERLVRKEHVALSVRADFVPGNNCSLILFTMVTSPKLAPQVEKSLMDEVRRLREDPLTDSETDQAATTVLNRISYASQSVEERAAWLAMLDITAPLIDPSAYTKLVTAVKAEDLNKLIGRYLTPLSYAVTMVGPPPPSEELGQKDPGATGKTEGIR